MRNLFWIIVGVVIPALSIGQTGSFSYNMSVTIDNVSTLNGGLKKGNAFLGLMAMDVTYQPANKIFQNTTFFSHLLKTTGESVSEQFIGDVQVASNIEGKSSLLFYELWVRQKLGNISLLAGMHDLNSEFFVSNHAGAFINSSFGISPGLSLNMPVSIFPVTTFGALLRYDKEHFSVLTGSYNYNHEFSSDEHFRINNHNFKNGLLSIGELQFRPATNNILSGTYKIGWFYKYCNKDGHGNDGICISERNYGAYFLMDKLIYETPDNKKNINGFLQLNLNPVQYNYASEYIGAGITMNGIISNKNPNNIGFAIARVKLNELNEDNLFSPGEYETTLELTLQQTFFNTFTIQPDIQYILNSGTSSKNAVVAILRMQMAISN